MALQERGAEQMQCYLLVSSSSTSPVAGGVCSEQGSLPAHCRGTWPRLSLASCQGEGAEGRLSLWVLWPFPERCPSGQVAGGRHTPVPRMSPEVTSSYLCGCSVSHSSC